MAQSFHLFKISIFVLRFLFTLFLILTLPHSKYKESQDDQIYNQKKQVLIPHFFSQSGVFCSLSRLVTSLIMQYNSLVFFLCICIHLCIKCLFLCINTIICDVLFRKYPFISLAIFPFLLQNILWIACTSLYAAYIRRFTGCKQHSCNNYMSVLGQVWSFSQYSYSRKALIFRHFLQYEIVPTLFHFLMCNILEIHI